MVMIRKNNGGNSQHFANATCINMPSSKIIPDCSHLNMCWIIDNGAMDHVTSSAELLDPKMLPKTTTISLPDGGDYYRKVLFCRPNYKGFKHL